DDGSGGAMKVTDEIDALIERYIEPHPHRPGVAEARVRGTGIPVWALVNRYRLTPGSGAAELVADAYGIEPEAMAAVIAYYKRYRTEIDSRIAALDVA